MASRLIGGRGKAGEIPGHPAAQRHQNVAAGQAVFREETQKAPIVLQAFGALPRFDHIGDNLQARGLQGASYPLSVEGKDVFPGDQSRCLRLSDSADLLAGVVQQAPLDQHPIVPARRDRNPNHVPSTSSFRRFPSSNSRTSLSRSSATMAARYSFRLPISQSSSSIR